MISAVIPVFRPDPAELDAALNSLIAARLADEIILVDDHNPHLPILQAWSERGAKVIQSRAPHTISGTRATGVHHATHPYVLSLDHDDLIFNDGFNPDDLAPINLASQNSPWTVATTIWDFIEHPGAIQWGSIIRTDLARAIAVEGPNRHEDLYWGYRLLLTAWRDRVAIRSPSGVRYWWRSEVGRDSMTARHTRDPASYKRHQREGLLSAVDQVGLGEPEASAIRALANRQHTAPTVLKTERGQRVDTHVLHFSGSIAWLKQTLASLETEPTNIQLVAGGFPGSIGQARAFAFAQGEAEYVSFLDDDDYAIPGAMQACVDTLDAHPECVGVYTDRYHEHANGRRDPERLGPWHWRRMAQRVSEVTHLKVMRRSAVMPYLEELKHWPTWEEYVLCGLTAKHGRWQHLPIFGAVKRTTDARVSSLRLNRGDLMRRARTRVIEHLRP